MTLTKSNLILLILNYWYQLVQYDIKKNYKIKDKNNFNNNYADNLIKGYRNHMIFDQLNAIYVMNLINQ